MQRLEFVAGFVYVLETVALSVITLYVLLLFPTLANQLSWAVVPGGLCNLHLGLQASSTIPLIAVPPHVGPADDDHLEDVVQGLHANELNTGLPTHYCWVDFWVDFDQHFQMARTAVCLARCAASCKTYAAVHLEAILRNVPLSGILLWRHLMTWQLRWHNRWATGVDESIAIVNAFGARQDVTMKSMAFHPRATGSKSTVLNAVIASDMSYVRLRNFSLVRGTSRSVTESVILANSGV
ncbi:hypothetical protein DYB30_010875 [Aphanomyces astaci]|uniref:Uncharacterized protein n=1 Tax=Aphanomyces astaci TaxID=112090 RepID=A0A397CVK3_APHAT|nr:hypothetical protein DYB30_010875 [Aphanomyces astaci]RHY85005.1 hypothetical protein DYB26_010116 [Aphanomyces astaci]